MEYGETLTLKFSIQSDEQESIEVSKSTKLCGGTLVESERIQLNSFGSFDMSWQPIRVIGVKHRRMKCPKCGRRMFSSVELDPDGDYLFHSLPPHKPKGWWHKKKERKEKTKESFILRTKYIGGLKK